MDHVDTLFLRQRDDAGDVEVSAHRTFAFADQIGFVGLEAVDREAIFLRVNGDGTQSEFGRGAEDANSNLAAIGNEQLFRRRLLVPRLRDRSGFIRSP